MLGVGQDDILIGEVTAGSARGVPAHLADIDRIAQDIFDGAVFKAVSPVGLDPHVIEPLSDGEETFAGNEAVKDGADQGGLLRNRNQHIVLHPVPERWGALEPAPAGFLRHAALDFFGQVQGVVFVHGLDHGFHDDAHFIVGQGLTDGDDVNAQLPAEHGLVDDAVFPVAGKTGELPEKDGVKGPGLLLGGADHAVELRPLFRMFAADALIQKDELIGKDIAMGGGILADLHQLGIRGEFHLVIGGDPNIGGGNFGERVSCWQEYHLRN